MLMFPPHMFWDFSHSSQYLRLKGQVNDLALCHSNNILCLLLANLPCCMCCSSFVSNAYLQPFRRRASRSYHFGRLVLR
jgi:hypothetical protein